MKRYDSYKDSGVEWMNKIPSNWEKSRIRMVGDLYGGLTGKKGSDFNDEDNSSNKPFVPFTNIFNNTYISKDHFQYVNVEENENQNRVLKNDLFFLMSSESYEDLGKCSILLEDVDELYLNSFCKGYRIKDSKVYPLFLNYQLLGSLHKEMISIEGNGFTRINLRQDRLLDIPVFIPPFSEQQQIVSFLDTKTSLIDSLIQKTQRKIELLKEKRTSLINEVVTKGLNPNVEMKDSGVGWIGEIPSHWNLKKVSYLCSQMISGPFGSSLKKEFYTKSGYKIYGQEQVIKDDFEYGDYYVSEEKYQELKRCQIYTDDILVSCVGTFGKISKVPEEFEPGIINPRLLKITPNKLISSNYFLKLLRSNISYSQFELHSRGGTMGVINLDILSRLIFPIPTIKEQQQIVEYLDEQTQLIAKTISIEEKRIELLKEYRQSLISEVLTGKRKICA